MDNKNDPSKNNFDVNDLKQIIVDEENIIKQNYGQFFTKNITLKEKVLELILNNPNIILEPSIGRGDLIRHVLQNNPNIIFDMYEIDTTIKLLKCINKNDVIYGNFLDRKINKKYKTIIGNPPYIKTKSGNIYIKFIDKCYELLKNNGELIFIIPSDFFKLTSSSTLLNKMLDNGTFTHIYHPHNEKLFENASIDVIVFRYCKNSTLNKKVLYNDEELFIINNDGLVSFSKKENENNETFDDYFEIFVGLVSGKEEVFKNNVFGNIEVINGKNKIDNYIFIEKFPTENKKLNKYMLKYKQDLLDRKIRKFNESNWFEWGAPRNISSINNNFNKKCIYIYNLTRREEVAFVNKVKYFGGGLLMLKPKKKCNLQNIVKYINSETFKSNFIFSGRFKIGHRQIKNSYIPQEYL